MSDKIAPHQSINRGLSSEKIEYIRSTNISRNKFILLAIEEKINLYPKIDEDSQREVLALYGKRKGLHSHLLRGLPVEHLEYIEKTKIDKSKFFLMAIFEKIKRDQK